MKIIVGTKNPKKIAVVTSTFIDVLGSDDIDVVGHNAASGVPEAPHDRQTYDGARNRARECRDVGGADYYIGIESGLVERYGHMFEEAWAVVIDNDGLERVGYSSGLMLPTIVSDRMQAGEMHNRIMEYFDEKFNLPDDNRDTWSRYTGGNISRQVSLEESLRNALIQIVHSEQNLYNYEPEKQA